MLIPAEQNDKIKKSVQKKSYQAKDKENTQTKIAKWGFWQTVIVSLITAIAGIITGYLALPHKMDALEKQGLSNITLEGKWK